MEGCFDTLLMMSISIGTCWGMAGPTIQQELHIEQ